MYYRFLQRGSNGIKILSLLIKILQISLKLTLFDRRVCVTTTFRVSNVSINKMTFLFRMMYVAIKHVCQLRFVIHLFSSSFI